MVVTIQLITIAATNTIAIAIEITRCFFLLLKLNITTPLF